MEELIIDGCNLAYKAYGGAGERERARLMRKLREYYAHKKIRVTVVFDSREGGDVSRLAENIKIRYAPVPADDYIVRIVRQSRRPRSLTVVTDDRSVAHRVRLEGARQIGSRDYLEKWKGWEKAGLGAPPAEEKPDSESREQMQRYLDIWEGGG